MNFYLYHDVGRRGSNQYTQEFMSAHFVENCITRRLSAENIFKMNRFRACLTY
jgi:hypothetical protein